MTVPGGNGRGEGGEGGERANHWHAFLARWQAASTTAGTCTSCHPGHATNGDPKNGFLNAQTVRNTCDACHRVLRQGDGG